MKQRRKPANALAGFASARPAPFNDVESAQLRRLVDQAFDLRESGYLGDAAQAIEDWYWRTLPDRLERAARGANDPRQQEPER